MRRCGRLFSNGIGEVFQRVGGERPRNSSGLDDVGHVGGGLGESLRVDGDIEASGEAAGEGTLEGGLDVGGVGDVFAVATHGLHDAVVAGGIERSGDGTIRPDHLLLDEADVAPTGVVADDADDGEVEAESGVELEAIEAESAVTVDDEHFFVGEEVFGGDGKGCADTEASERAGV